MEIAEAAQVEVVGKFGLAVAYRNLRSGVFVRSHCCHLLDVRPSLARLGRSLAS